MDGTLTFCTKHIHQRILMVILEPIDAPREPCVISTRSQEGLKLMVDTCICWLSFKQMIEKAKLEKDLNVK